MADSEIDTAVQYVLCVRRMVARRMRHVDRLSGEARRREMTEALVLTKVLVVLERELLTAVRQSAAHDVELLTLATHPVN